MKKLNYLFLMFLSLTFIACEDDTDAVLDNEDPTITIVSPTSQFEYYPDEEVLVDATVRDNLGLESVAISVTPPGGVAQVVHTEDVSDFLNDNTEADIEEVISLGTATPPAGSYIITVTATDERGNVAEQSVTINILEEDLVAPAVVVTSPELNSVYDLGDSIEIDAEIEEAEMLREVNITLGPTGGDALETWNITEGFVAGTPFVIDETFTLPADAPVGNYELVIEAEDLAGNIDTERVAFSVQEAATE